MSIREEYLDSLILFNEASINISMIVLYLVSLITMVTYNNEIYIHCWIHIFLLYV